jgi:diguanylate cyclase (GGDEF)-like protein
VSDFLTLVRETIDWRPPTLRFDAEREHRFHVDRAAARLQHFISSGLVALIIYNLYLLSDRIMVPDMFETALCLRLFIFTPIAIGLMVLGLRFRPWVLSLSSFTVEGILMMTGVYAALTMGVVLAGTTSPFGIMYRAGLISILLYGNVVQRFRFRYAVAFSACVVLICLYSMKMTLTKGHPYAILDVPLLLLILIIATYTLAINYRMELQERRRFMHAERAATMRQEIETSHLALEALARQDPLTGLPNRRHFDDAMQHAWAHHGQTKQPLALLLIDVDHFKAYNDRYGHPTGDLCLRNVAQSLQSMVPPTLGTVARWGGEEFIVLLPQADEAQAMAVAQALTQGVASLNLRHEASPTASTVTISVGVMADVPGLVWTSADEFVSRADKALYRAKGEGRNRFAVV